MEKEILDSEMSPQAGLRYAGFWIRVGASLIDMLILLPAYGMFIYAVYFEKSFILAMLGLLIASVYKPLLEAVKSATFGKMAVKIQVINKDNNKISVVDSLIRNSPWIISAVINLVMYFLLFRDEDFMDAEGFLEISEQASQSSMATLSQYYPFLILIIVLAVAFTAKKQGLHDMLADTYVVEKW